MGSRLGHWAEALSEGEAIERRCASMGERKKKMIIEADVQVPFNGS